MKKSEKSGCIAVSALTSAAICALSLCFFINGNGNYASAENSAAAGTFYANAEITESQYSSRISQFDNSLWGKLAKALSNGIDAWQG